MQRLPLSLAKSINVEPSGRSHFPVAFTSFPLLTDDVYI
jgi:hypothetical protein